MEVSETTPPFGLFRLAEQLMPCSAPANALARLRPFANTVYTAPFKVQQYAELIAHFNRLWTYPFHVEEKVLMLHGVEFRSHLGMATNTPYVHKPKDKDKHEHFIKHLVYIVVRDKAGRRFFSPRGEKKSLAGDGSGDQRWTTVEIDRYQPISGGNQLVNGAETTPIGGTAPVAGGLYSSQRADRYIPPGTDSKYRYCRSWSVVMCSICVFVLIASHFVLSYASTYRANDVVV
ncbi:hypothetical protein BHE74_00003632 [Ensete ventricosum]|nr:hypothetical protein BHE74_00003632 [Ensete ventricosum]